MRKILAVALIVIMAIALVACNNTTGTQDTTTAYTVIFDSAGGTASDSQMVKEGETAVKPMDPEKEGFTFVEWQLDGVAYDFNSVVSQDITLIANYSINENTEIVLVMLDYQNGQETGIVEIIKGGKMAVPPTPVKQGYKFIGWFDLNSKFDFDTSLNEGITLTAKWEEDKTETPSNNKNNNTNNQTNVGNNTTPSTGNNDNSQQNNQTNNANYDDTVEKYVGRWYLSGYADVCIDVSKYAQYYKAMEVLAHNFSWGESYINGQFVYGENLIYAGGGGMHISYEDWEKDLSKRKIVLGNNCIYIANHKFVKEQGIKDKYSDTCYREALGIWYLQNHPDSYIEIKTGSTGGIDNSDYFTIDTHAFHLTTFDTSYSSSGYGGYADRQADWDKYGISVSNGVLTIANNNGIRKFEKTKTYIKVSGVSLDVSNVELSVKQTKKLKMTIAPSDAYYKTVTWSSSNSSVASVSSGGVITANSEGTAVITVKTTDGEHIAKCNVTVIIPRATAISLNKNSTELYKGDSETLTATITPSDAVDKTVSWSSSDESIVTVSTKGKITAKKHGTATITVTTKDGGHTATCTVTVVDPPLTVRASIGVGYYMSDSASVRGVYAEAKASGGSGNYVEYYIKVYYNGQLVAEGEKNQIIVTLANGTYTAEVYVKDSNGNEATHTSEMTLSGY